MIFRKKNKPQPRKEPEFFPPITCEHCTCAAHFTAPGEDRWTCKIWNAHPIDPDGWCYKGAEYTYLQK